MNRRDSLLASAAGAAGVLAAACSSGGATEARPTNAGACKGTLDVVSPWAAGTPEGDRINLMGQDFAATHPGCSAQVLWVAGNNTEILTKLVAAIAAGSQPPVAFIPAQQTPTWIAQNVAQPLDSWAKRDQVTKDLFFEGYWPQMMIDGKLWRLPFNIDVNFPWFRNLASLRNAGASVDQVPTTIEALDALAALLTRGAPGAYEQVGFVPWGFSGTGLGNSLQSWVYAYGGDFYDAAKDKVIANHPKTVQALEWLVGWTRKLGGMDAVEAQVANWGGYEAAHGTGRIAMYGLPSSGQGTLQQKYPDLRVSVTLFPGGPGVKPGEATWLSGRGVGIVAGAKDPDSAWEFVRWVGASKEGTLAAVNRVKATPGLKASPGLAILEQDPLYRPFVDSLRVAKHNPPGALMPTDVWGNGRGMWVTEVLQGKRSARETLDEITRTAQVDLDAERKRLKQ
jgi:multiple sugar transport system substrate-binding protein